MQTLEQLLRDEFGRADAAIPLETAPMIRRVGAVRRRRAVLTAVAGVTVAALVAGGASWSALHRNTLPAGKNMTKVTGVLDLIVTDQNTAYMTTQSCLLPAEPSQSAPARDAGDCDYYLFVTRNGGRTWLKRSLPGLDRPYNEHQNVYQFLPLNGDPETVAVYKYESARQWITTNAGRTWRAVPRAPSTTVSAIPPDANLIPGFIVDRNNTEPAVIRPNGETSVLATRLAGVKIENADTPPGPASDGSYWLACQTSAGKPCAAFTTDRGKSWHVVAPPVNGVTTTVSTRDGRTVYLGVTDSPADGPNATSDTANYTGIPVPLTPSGGRLRSCVFRSVDRGQTWQQIPLPVADISAGVSVQALPDGGAAATFAGGSVYRLPPGGREFVAESGESRGWLRQSGPWLLAYDQDPGGGSARYLRPRIYKSADGVTWAEIQIP